MSAKKILLLGAGFVARPCVEVLARRPENRITVACRHISTAQGLASQFPASCDAVSLDVGNQAALEAAVAAHDLVISLIPYTFHPLVIAAAIKHGKHVVTTSYVSDAMAAYDEAAKKAGVTVLNEIGLDPGIDHLYAVKIIDEVHAQGGEIVNFLSYCGGLPAPEASNNPLGYKFSWSSRGVLLALRNNAKLYEDGKMVEIPGPELMDAARPIYIYPAFAFVGYPNRDSTPYKERYNIPEAQTIVRGTLRYQGFPRFVKALVILGFLDDTPKAYLATDAADIAWNQVFANVLGTTSTSFNELYAAAKAKIGFEDAEAERILSGFKWLGMFSDKTAVRRGNLLDTLCAVLEEKMQYGDGERDMVMLQHRFDIRYKDGRTETRTSTLLDYGVPNGDTSMAKTVGVPCGIATQMILDGQITKTGVLAPVTSDLALPLIEALEKEGIKMVDEVL